MPYRTTIRFLVVLVLVFGASAIGAPASAVCASSLLGAGTLASAEAEVAGLTNAARGDAGVPELAPDERLAKKARSHADRMAGEGRIFHSDGLGGWIDDLGATLLAENVGMGCSARAIHDAFLASPSHRENLLNGRLTHAGYGTASGPTGALFVVQVFAAYPAPMSVDTPSTPRQASPPSASPTPRPTLEPTPVPPPPTPPTPEPAEPTPDPTAEPTPDPTAEPTPDPTAEPTPSPASDEGTRLVAAAGWTEGSLEAESAGGAPTSFLTAGAVLMAALALVAAWWSRRTGVSGGA